MDDRRLRVALVAGTLGQGGAERQLTYMARALRGAGADVRAYCLTRGEHHEAALREAGVPLVWVGRHRTPPVRAAVLARALRDFAPHVIQAGHFYTNLYVAIAARCSGAVSIGAVRSDVVHELAATGVWGPWLLRAPDALIANSAAARETMAAMHLDVGRVHVVPNVIDVARFDALAHASASDNAWAGRLVVIGIGRFIPAKRFDRFLTVLALARRQVPDLLGVLVGDGPEEPRLRALAAQLGLLPPDIQFLGRRTDVPALLRRSDFLLLTSDYEGFPNVVLEAMTAAIPVIATSAGDVERVTSDGETGCIVPGDNDEALAARLVDLARAPDRRRAMGDAARRRVLERYSATVLPAVLRQTYQAIAEQRADMRLAAVLAVEQ